MLSNSTNINKTKKSLVDFTHWKQKKTTCEAWRQWEILVSETTYLFEPIQQCMNNEVSDLGSVMMSL